MPIVDSRLAVQQQMRLVGNDSIVHSGFPTRCPAANATCREMTTEEHSLSFHAQALFVIPAKAGIQHWQNFAVSV